MRHGLRDRVRRAAWLVVLGALACDSTALSLGDPNDLNATLVPPFITEDDPNSVWTLTLNTGATAGAADDTADLAENSIVSADFGPGVRISGSGYLFKSQFVVELYLKRYAEAEPGTRTFTVRFINAYGEFLAHGEINVY
ncbi:hypothetical protein L6V77_20300 [Myxococcota bacterium]|jgi:hypothetical protein|nr:hypothetical protein [Myxococcota bacterium]